jgi:hypothetical protein
MLNDQVKSVAEEDMPNCVQNQQEYNYDIHVKSDRWADVLWPFMAWTIYIFNAAVAISFVVDLVNGNYDHAKHITTIFTMCGSYIALTWAYKNILRDVEYGRFE